MRPKIYLCIVQSVCRVSSSESETQVSGEREFTADRLHRAGYHPTTINGVEFWAIDELTVSGDSSGMQWSHPLLDMQAEQHHCQHCGELSGALPKIRHIPAFSIAEAVERGYLVRAPHR